MYEINLILLTFAILGLSFLLFFPLISFLKFKFSKTSVRNLNHIQPVSILITCFNEEDYIKNRIDYFLDEKEWIENSEIIVISTGSNDKTNEILNKFRQNDHVKVILLENRLSKIKTLNRFMSECKNEIIIFSDCRQIIEKNAVKKLVRHFSDPMIDVVSSTLEDTKNKKNISIFRSLLNKIAIWESKNGSSLNLFGALYAQRKSAFRPFPEDLLFDDLYVVVSTLKQNKRLIQDKEAIIKDVDFNNYYQKERIERLVRGLLIFLHKEKKLIFSLKKKQLFRFLVFKYMKLLMPFFILITILELIYFSYGNIVLISSFLLVTIIPLLFNSSRKTILQFIRINFYFMTSIFKFYLKKKRDNSWKPLNINETKQAS